MAPDPRDSPGASPRSSPIIGQNRRGDREQRDDQRRDDGDERRPNNEVPASRREDRDPFRRDRDGEQERKERRGS
jgi:hypothetical protein